jgi:hypothetical protein
MLLVIFGFDPFTEKSLLEAGSSLTQKSITKRPFFDLILEIKRLFKFFDVFSVHGF